MSMKFPSDKVGFLIIVALIGHALFLYYFDAYYSKAPLVEDIDLKSTFEKEFDIKVPMSQTYEVELRFAREGKDFEYLNSILGDMISGNEDGIPLNVSWRLISDGEVLAQNKLVAGGSCGWSQQHVYRCLGSFKVPPGKYKFILKISEPGKVFGQFKTSISIGYSFKSAHTWQTTYIFWAVLFNIFVAPFLVGVILLGIIVRHLKTFVKERSNARHC